MTARRYEVSFRAELDDRQVDEVADTLFELGWDDICFRPIPEPLAEQEKQRIFDEVNRRYGKALEHYGRADSTRDRDALRAADQHDLARELKH